MPAFAMNLAASHSASALSLNVSSHASSFIPPIMHVLSTAVLLGSVAVQKVLGRPGPNGLSGVIEKRSVDDFINTQTPIALNNLLCNVGPDGCRAFGTSAGAVIASPSTTDPDYYYMWTRDSALVFKNIVDRFTQQYDAGLQRRIEQYISAQVALQGISNPSGSLSDGSGLGEPKFELTLSQFTGNWGRPQRDGPALRAIALIGYSKWLINNNYQSTVSNIIWPIVRNDLNYVAQYWNQTGFDLWEEVNGSSFFTVANQHRALVEGATLAATLGQSGSTYSSVAPQVLCFLQRFWVSGGYIDSNINTNEGRTGKDANSLLASIHTFDPSLGCDASTFQPCSDKALSNLKVVVDSFRSIYGVNKGIPAGSAVAIGRYPEDVYFNGNPWYLATFAAAEQLYDSVYVWKKAGSITVTSTSLAFFQELVPGVAAGTYSSSQSTFTSIINAVSTYADGFLSEAAKYVPADGSLAEQFDRNTGTPLSAVHLTWSYASFLTATARRAGVVPPSWASSGANSVPSSCSGASVVGSYSRPTATSFPPSQTPKPGVPSGTPFTPIPCATPASVAVTFHELATTQFGQTIKVAGSAPELGNWSTSAAIALDAVNYATNHPLWIGSVNLEAGDVIEYKYINVGQDGSVTWESDPNHTYTVPAVACVTEVVKEDTWQS